MRTENAGVMYHGCGGTCRGILLMRTGYSGAAFLNPKYEPTNTSSTEMPNHICVSASSVPKGTAPEDFCPQTIRFSKKNMMKHTPENMNAVCRVLISLEFIWN